MKKLILLFVFAAVGLVQPAWSCDKPGCPYGLGVPHPEIKNTNIVEGGDAKATVGDIKTGDVNVKTGNVNTKVDVKTGDVKTIAKGGEGGAGGAGGAGGSVDNVAGGNVGDIVIGGTNITVPRNFSELPPAVQQQFSFAFGALYMRSHLDREEKRLLNDMLGPVPNPGSLSRETVSRNATSKFDIGIKQVLNELPVFEFLIKGDKGVSNFKAKLEFTEDLPPVGPAESLQFIQKLDGTVKFQIVDRSDLEAAGWQIGTSCVIQGVPGVWLSGLKWAGYKLLMKQTGYVYGAVTGVYRSNIGEASGKNLQLGGAGNFLTGGAEQNAYNLFLGGGKGSGQNWESQKFDIVLAGLKKAQPDAPLLIGLPKPPAEVTVAPTPQKEAPPEEKCEAEKQEKAKLQEEKAKLQADIDCLKKLLKEASEKGTLDEAEKVKLQNKIRDLDKALADLTAKNSLTEKEKAELQDKIGGLEKKLQAAGEDRDKWQTTAKDALKAKEETETHERASLGKAASLEKDLKEEREAHDGTMQKLAGERLSREKEKPEACPFVIEYPFNVWDLEAFKIAKHKDYRKELEKIPETVKWIKETNENKEGKGEFRISGHGDFPEKSKDATVRVGIDRARYFKAHIAAAGQFDKELTKRMRVETSGNDELLVQDTGENRQNRHVCLVWVPDEGGVHGHAHLHAAQAAK